MTKICVPDVRSVLGSVRGSHWGSMARPGAACKDGVGRDAGRARHDDFTGVSGGVMLGYHMTKTKTYKYAPEVPKTRPLSDNFNLKYIKYGFDGKPMVEVLWKDSYRATVFYCDEELGIATNQYTWVSSETVALAKAFLDEHLAAKPVEYVFETLKYLDTDLVRIYLAGVYKGTVGLESESTDRDVPAQVLAAAKTFLRECLAEARRDEPVPETYVYLEPYSTTTTRYKFKYYKYALQDPHVCVTSDARPDYMWVVHGDDRDLGCTIPATVLRAAREYLARCEGKTEAKDEVKPKPRVYSWQDVCSYGAPFFPYIPMSVGYVSRDYLKDRSWTK